MQNKIKRIANFIKLVFFMVVVMALFGIADAEKNENIENVESRTVNALIFNNKGQIIQDGKYPVRFAVYKSDRRRVDEYPSNKDEEDRVWSVEKIVNIQDGKLRAELEIPSVKYSRYYLGIRMGKDGEMVPRKAIILGAQELQVYKEGLVNIETFDREGTEKVIQEGFRKQTEVNNLLVESINKLQIEKGTGNVPILNKEGKIDRSLLDLPIPAGTGGLRAITLNLNTNATAAEVINNLVVNQDFINSVTNNAVTTVNNGLAQNMTSNSPSDGEGIIYESSSDSYVSTVLTLELLRDINLSSVEENDFLVYEDDEWVNKKIEGENGIEINDFKVSLNAGISKLTDVDTVTTAPLDGQVLSWNGTSLKWEPVNSGGSADTQDLSIAGHTISLVNGGSVVVPDNDTLNALSCSDGEIVKWNNSTTQWECAVDAGGSGVVVFTGLTDTPANYAGAATYLTRVNAAGNALEFIDSSTYLDNTDTQNLSISGHTISLVNGGNVVVPDNNTTYTAGGTLLNLSGTAFSVNEGTLSDGRICIYTAINGLVCTTDYTNWDTAYSWGSHIAANYLTGITGQNIQNLSNVYSAMSPTDGQVLTYDTATSRWQSETSPAGVTTFTGLTDTPNTYTAGSLLFTSGSEVTQDNANLFWDDLNNRLGIGITGPTQALHIEGGARLTGGYYDTNNEAGTSGQILSSTGAATDWIDQYITSINSPLSISGQALSVAYDNSTVGLNGSNQLYILNGGVTTLQLADDAVTNLKLADNSVDSANYVDDSIDDVHINWGTGADQVYAGLVPVQDSGNYYTQSNVETVLQHLGSNASKRWSTGLTNGGVITDAGSDDINISAGSGFINNATNKLREITWSAISAEDMPNTGDNFIYMDAAGSVHITGTKASTDDYIYLGYVYTIASGTDIGMLSSSPYYAGNYESRNNNMVDKVIGTIVESGNIVTEHTTDLELGINSGTIHSKLSEYSALDTNSFTKWYDNNGTWAQDTSNLNTVSTSQYNNTSSGLASLTSSYWKKDLVLRTLDGNVHYIYGQVEYATEDGAKEAALPTIPSTITNAGSAYLATIVSQEGDTSIENRLYDIRPNMSRVFGFGTNGTVGSAADHGILTGLTDDDHTQYLLATGARVMTGKLDLGDNAITGVTDLTMAGTFQNTSTTNPQMRVGYDGSNYYTTAVGSSGAVTFDATGTATSFTFADNLTASGNLTVTNDAVFNNNTIMGDAATDTLTIVAVLQGANPLVFEGITDDTFETTFSITDPTADRTITFQDVSGTVAYTSDLTTAFTSLTDTPNSYTAGSLLFTSNSGVIENNTNLFWNDSTDRLGIGTNSPSTKLSIFGTDNAMRLAYDGSNYADLSVNSSGELLINATNATETAIIIGSGLAHDTSIQFDGSGHNFFSGIDEATSSYSIGSGLSVGSSIVEAGPGTVTNTAGGTAVTGAGTKFTSTFRIGNQIMIGTDTVTISAIASDTAMTTDAVTTANTGAAYTYNAGTVVTIEPSGNLGIGTANPLYALDVKATGTSAVIARFNNDSTNTSCTLTSNGGTLNCSSDERLKKNILTIQGGMETLMKLRPAMYNWKTDGDDVLPTYGFIAQEVQNIIPQLVRTDEESGYLQLSTIGMIPTIVQAVQELHLNQEREEAQLTHTTFKTDANITNLTQLQTSIDDNLLLINQELTTLQADISTNTNEIIANAELITINKMDLALLSTNVDLLVELINGTDAVNGLITIVTDHELRIAGIEAILGAGGVDLTVLEQNISSTKYTISDTLQTFSDKLEVITGDRGQRIFTLSGDLIVERVTANEIEIEKINIRENGETIGVAIICPVGYSVRDSDCAVEIDEDKQSDGRSVFVENSSVGADTIVFTAFEDNPNTPSWVEKEDNKNGFTIKLGNTVENAVRVNWWMIEKVIEKKHE